MKPKAQFIFRTSALLCAAAVFCFASLVPEALATSSVSIASDTNVLLPSSGITLTLASGSTLVSYSVDTSTLTLNLDPTSNVTVKSANLYTLNNSQEPGHPVLRHQLLLRQFYSGHQHGGYDHSECATRHA